MLLHQQVVLAILSGAAEYFTIEVAVADFNFAYQQDFHHFVQQVVIADIVDQLHLQDCLLELCEQCMQPLSHLVE